MSINKNNNRQRGNRKEFKIPSDAKKLVKLSWKKFKKDSDYDYMSKKEKKEMYHATIVDLLPDSIRLVVNYGHINEVKDTKEGIFEKITDPEFVKYLSKRLKKDNIEFCNMELLPIIISEIVKSAQLQEKIENEQNPDSQVEYDMSDVIEISKLILNKKIKKFKKAGLDEDLAFDVLSIIPTPEVLKKSKFHYIRNLFVTLYAHAKEKEIDFGRVIKCLFKNNDDYIPEIITFALLERKEKITSFTDTQKKLFNNITEFCFKTMEDMKKDEIQNILNAYVESRKRDESQNKDANRRYYISSLPEKDYPHIIKVVSKMCDKDENIKKYL